LPGNGRAERRGLILHPAHSSYAYTALYCEEASACPAGLHAGKLLERQKYSEMNVVPAGIMHTTGERPRHLHLEQVDTGIAPGRSRTHQQSNGKFGLPVEFLTFLRPHWSMIAY
jgi:hypothetical protein